MLILFVFTLATAFHYELSRIFPHHINKNLIVATAYLVGSIFFLFWSEPYIMPNIFFALFVVQMLSFLVNSIVKPTQSFIDKWNIVESKVTLSILVVTAVYAIKYFYEIV